PRVVQPSNRRTDLPRQPAAYLAVRPRRWTSAQRPNRSAGEEVVGAQARHGIAGQKEHEAFTDASKAGRAAGPHRNPVNGKLAVLRDEGRREVFDADARATGDDGHIGIGLKRRQDLAGLIGHQAGKVDQTAVTFDKGGEYGSVGVDDAITLRPQSRGEQFVACHHQPDARSAGYRYLTGADRTEHA